MTVAELIAVLNLEPQDKQIRIKMGGYSGSFPIIDVGSNEAFVFLDVSSKAEWIDTSVPMPNLCKGGCGHVLSENKENGFCGGIEATACCCPPGSQQ